MVHLGNTLGIYDIQIRFYRLKTFLKTAGHWVDSTAVGRKSVEFKAIIVKRKLIGLYIFLKLGKCNIVFYKTGIIKFNLLCNTGRKNGNIIIIMTVLLNINRTAGNRTMHGRKIRYKVVLVF